MGAWGGLVMFDYNKYSKVIIPAFYEGLSNPIIKKEIELLNYKNRNYHPVPSFKGIENVMNTFDSSFKKTSLTKKFIYFENKIVLNPKNFNYQKESYWSYENLVDLFEYVITRYCFLYTANFGLTTGILDSFIKSKDSASQELICRLSTNANFWQHSGGGWSEGIHGWLDVDETKLMSLAIDKIELHPNRESNEEWQTKIKTFKTIIREAAKRKMGILWGADLHVLYSIKWQNVKNGSIVKITDDIKNHLHLPTDGVGEVANFE